MNFFMTIFVKTSFRFPTSSKKRIFFSFSSTNPSCYLGGCHHDSHSACVGTETQRSGVIILRPHPESMAAPARMEPGSCLNQRITLHPSVKWSHCFAKIGPIFIAIYLYFLKLNPSPKLFSDMPVLEGQGWLNSNVSPHSLDANAVQKCQISKLQ